jgi:hypothetical protein
VPGSKTVLVAAVVCASACGARSGVDVEPPPERDAGLGFDTFPCRWSLTQDVEVERGFSYDGVFGAVHPSRDEVAILLRSRGSGFSRWSGARLTVGDPPSVVGPLAPGVGGEMMAYADGWAVLTEACEHAVFDDRFGIVSVEPLGGPSCTLEPSRDSFDVTSYGRTGGVAFLERRPDGIGGSRRTPISAAGSDLSRAVNVPPVIAVSRIGSALVGQYAMGDPQELAMSGAFDVARDDLRAGIVLLHAAADGFHVARVSPALGPLFLDELAGPSAFGHSPPRGTVVTNETEALVPLRDGRVAAIPLSGTAPRILNPVHDGGPPVLMRVILRTSASTGGVIYVHEEGIERVARFRSLVCNR